jgi:AAA15 family ATPase/GTPase
MLIRFRVSNFRSLRDEQELSMVAAFRDGRKDLVRADSLGMDLLRVAGVYGANAAGKSNVLDALRFMRDAVVESHRTWEPKGLIPREPFRLDPVHQEKESLFEVDILLEGERYQYGFELDSRRILREWLYAFPNKRRQVWFTRDVEAGKTFHFGKQLRGNNRAIEKITRENSLFLSAAAQNAHEVLEKIYSWFLRIFIGDVDSREYWTLETTRILEKRHREILDLLRLADLGIVDVGITDPVRREWRNRRVDNDWAEGANKVLEFKHQSASGPVALTLGDQSRGTQAWFSLVGAILEALDTGGLLCLDEIDASLHSLLTVQLIRFFQDTQRNQKNAQLIFNTHDTVLLGSLLAEPVLRRDQIWFVEKDKEGASSVYPLSDFKPRKFENIERGYIQGRYGAIPFIDPSEAA